jgi:crotonobetainyl-CoA:carnitine CoA-transferase CaiB-like acyl-CoA transferase
MPVNAHPDPSTKAPAALAGVRVICFGMGGAAPLATATLGDFGAEIIKIEPPSGDWSRTTPGLGTREFNRNKKGIAIDLKHPEGLALVRRLIADADVVMESFRPGVMDRLGLGYAALSELNPRLVYCSVSAFGQTGPWKDRGGVDGILQAVSGIMSVVGREGEEDLEPMKVSFPVVDMTGGLLAAQGILTALLARERYGFGQHVDLSLLEAAMVIQKSSFTRYLHSRKLPPKTGSRAPYATPNEAYRTKDGYLMLAAYSPARWKAFCRVVLGRPDVETDPRFVTRDVRQKHVDELKVIIEEVFATRTSAEWTEICLANDLLCAPILTYDQVVELDHVVERGVVDRIAFPDGREMRTVAPTPKLSRTPGRITRPYPEFVGQQTREVLTALGLSAEEIDRLREEEVIGVAE